MAFQIVAPRELVDSPPCSCRICKGYCARPCWPLPSEIAPIVSAGEGARLMLDWWDNDFHGGAHDHVYIVCPALSGHEGGMAPEVSLMDSLLMGRRGPLHGGCVFYRKGLCELHDRGLKPTEGRVCHHAGDQSWVHEEVARRWDTDEGRAAVAAWCSTVDFPNPYEMNP